MRRFQLEEESGRETQCLLMLFNAVVAMFMDKINKSIGTGSGSQEKCNYIAFADDLFLLSTDIGMKMMLKQLEAKMTKVGLIMNPEKYTSMRTEVVSKWKQWVVNPMPYLKLQEKEIIHLQAPQCPDMAKNEICITCRQNSERPSFYFACSTQTLSKTEFLNTHLLPSLVNYLTFEKLALQTLDAADIAIRGSVRRWL